MKVDENIEDFKSTGIEGRLHIALYATRNLPSRRSVEVDRDGDVSDASKVKAAR